MHFIQHQRSNLVQLRPRSFYDIQLQRDHFFFDLTLANHLVEFGLLLVHVVE